MTNITPATTAAEEELITFLSTMSHKEFYDFFKKIVGEEKGENFGFSPRDIGSIEFSSSAPHEKEELEKMIKKCRFPALVELLLVIDYDEQYEEWKNY